jgi:hypothetical protein
MLRLSTPSLWQIARTPVHKKTISQSALLCYMYARSLIITAFQGDKAKKQKGPEAIHACVRTVLEFGEGLGFMHAA